MTTNPHAETWVSLRDLLIDADLATQLGPFPDALNQTPKPVHRGAYVVTDDGATVYSIGGGDRWTDFGMRRR